ncbi:MAG: SDR family NAD(P)-dependent oxidoreductase, partial [Halanaerobiales bacterium]
MNLQDRIAIVTGSSRGIGATTACMMAEAGADLVINYPFPAEKENAEAVKEEVASRGRKAIVVEADVSRMDEAKKLMKKAKDEYNKIDILVNNAGITRDNLLIRM